MVQWIRKVRSVGLRKALRVGAAYVWRRDTTIVVRKDLSHVESGVPDVAIEFRWLDPSEAEPFMRTHRGFNADDVRDFAERGSRCLGAFVDGRLAGYVWIHYDFYEFPFFRHTLRLGPGEAFVGPALVAPEFRGRHIYTSLLTRSFEVLQSEGYRVAYGNVGVSNVPSIKGIVRAGFQPFERITAVRVLRRFLVYYSKRPCNDFS